MRRGSLVVAVMLMAVTCSLQGAPDAEQIASGAAVSALHVNTPPDEVYATWNRFCRAHFGAEKEPLVYQLYGDRLETMAGGDWTHVSATSVCVAWETNLPATSWIEYGPDAACGKSTAKTERPFYIHVHTLAGLETGKPVFVRKVSVDERGNRIASPPVVLVPVMSPGAVSFPAEGQEPPYVLDKPNTTYLLTRDITAKRTAIEVTAANVTLDLDGHTVVYHDETLPKETFDDPWMSYVNKGAVGVKNFGQAGFTLLNGTVREGQGNNVGNSESTGFIPVYMRDVGKVHVAGVTVDYWTPQNTGVRMRGVAGDVEVHHCIFLDRGCRIVNRHGAAVRSLSFLNQKGAGYRVHHNLIKRTRQMGFLGANELVHNEIYTDSWSVNSFALGPHSEGGVAHHNRIFGTGVNLQGFGWGTSDMLYHHNLIHLQGIDTGKNRNKEGWGDQDSLNGFRVTNYDKGGQKRDNLLYHDNVVVIRCRGGSQARGTEFFSDETITGLVFRNNVIKVIAEDEKTTQVACVVTHGQAAKADTCLPVWYRDCTLMSNYCIIRFSDYYGKGSNHHFINCRLERIGDDQRFRTFIFDGGYWSKRHVLLDCTFGEGTAPDDVFWKITSGKSFYDVQWTLTLTTLPGAKVTVKDAAGEVAFEGAAATGKLEIPLTQYRVQMPEKTKTPSEKHVKHVKTPHAVTVELAGRTKTETVNMTEKRTITLIP